MVPSEETVVGPEDTYVSTIGNEAVGVSVRNGGSWSITDESPSDRSNAPAV
jgi:hypothetical protein